MMKLKSGRLLTIMMALLVATGAQAVSDAWNMDAAGNWDVGGNWLNSNVPGLTTADNPDVATFSYTLTADCIITVDAPRYIGGISFGNASTNKYTLSSGLLRLNNGGVIQTLAGNGDHSDTIDTPIQLDGATAFFTANATSANSLLRIGAVTGSATAGNTTTLTLDGSNPGANAVTGVISDGSGGGNLALVKNSAGVWRLSGPNTYQGGTTVNAGTVDVYGDQSAATGGWVISPTSVNLVTNSFKGGSTIVVAAGKSIQVGNTTSSGSDYTIVNVAGAVTNQGSFLVGRGATVNLYSGTKWQQAGDMSITGYGGRNEYLNVNSGSTFDYIGANTIKVNPSYNSSGGAVLTIRGLFNTQQAFERTETLTSGSGKVSLSNGGRLRLTGPVEQLTLYPPGKLLLFSLDNGGGMIDTDTNVTAITCVISGSGTLTKSGTGTLTLSAANTYSGATTNESGTLRLTGGDNRLYTGGAFVFPATSTLDVDTTAQTLSSITVTSTGSVITVKGNKGALAIIGSTSLEIGPGSNAKQVQKSTLDMSDLGSFTFDAATATFRVGLRANTNDDALDEIARVTLASTNLIRASLLAVGDKGGNNDGGLSILSLGQENQFRVNTINSGYSGRSDTRMEFAAGLVAPKVTIRNTDGSSAVTTWSIGNIAHFAATTFSDIVDFSRGTIDASITTLNIGTADSGIQLSRAGTENATFSMGLGSLTASTVNLGRMINSTNNAAVIGGTYRANGTFTLDGGTVNATTLAMAVNTINDTSSNSKIVSGTFNLSNGTLRVATVQLGAQTGAATPLVAFNWVKGTIGNISGSDLVWTNIPVALQTVASHVVDITGAANTATFDAASVISGSGCALTKTGAGTLKLCGANTYNGGTIVSNGTLVAGGNNALAAGSDLVLSGGAFDTGSFANTLDMLTLGDSTASQLLVGDPGCLLSFTGMSGTGTLMVTGTLGSTSVRFGASDSALTGEQLSRISVNGFPAALSVAGYLREARGTLIQFR